MTKAMFHGICKSLLSITLISCAAGGGETGTGQNPDTVTEGVISGFGSVIVNGIKYETDENTSVTLDGSKLSESHLKTGMVVTLTAKTSTDGTTKTAASITFDDNVEGMVSENTIASNNQLIVLGQTIIIDPFDTLFESNVDTVTSLEEIQVNNIIEVSGHSDGNGTIYATFIEVKKASRTMDTEVELEGLVSNATDTTFQIGNLTIDYSQAVLSDFNGTAISDGDYVEVKSTDDLNNNLQLIAAKVELKKQHKTTDDLGDKKEFEIEGMITASLDNSQFRLNGQVIRVNEETQISEESSLIIAGKKAKVEGYFNQNQFIAKEIEIKKEDRTKIEGLITEIDPENKTITVLDEVIFINRRTRVKDDRDDIDDDDRHFFNFSNLEVGHQVEVSYHLDANSNRIASKLELDDVKDEPENNEEEEEESYTWEVKGVITDYEPSMNTITLNTRTINVANISGFLGTAAIGKKAEVKGTIIEGIWQATELEIEDD